MIAELQVFRFLTPIARFLFGYRIEGGGNLPARGPFIILYAEYSLLCNLYNAFQTAALLSKKIAKDKVLIFLAEELFTLPYFHSKHLRSFLDVFPLLPQGAGKYNFNLMTALEHLNRDGMIILNPEGDMSRDGRPLPIQGGAAWLGLHGAVPMVPIVPTAETYDAWPPWQFWPNTRGRAIVRIGKPFRVTEKPLDRVRDEDMQKAVAKIRAEMSALRFGPGGVAAWTGPPTKQGDVLSGPLPLPLSPDIPPRPMLHRSSIPAWRQGIPLLLWRCPICHMNDSLSQRRRPFKAKTVSCSACGTVWTVTRIPGHDFRLQVIKGPQALFGLNLSLSGWYDEMKKDFRLGPAIEAGKEYLPREEMHLQTTGVKLLLDKSNSLRKSWAGREAPDREFPARAGDWLRLGPGKLTLTSLRLIWDSPQGCLDFWWPRVKTVHLRSFYLLSIGYGVTPYRFLFHHESGLKWLTCAGGLVRQNHPHIKISPY